MMSPSRTTTATVATVAAGLALSFLLILGVITVWGVHETNVTGNGSRATGTGTAPTATGAPVPPGTTQTAPSAGGASSGSGAAGQPTKRGIGGNTYVNTDGAKIRALGVSWEYNWSVNMPADTGGTEFVPMIWGKGSATAERLAALTAGREAGLYRNLLAFNEPDHAKQANMSVDQALDLWPKLESTGLRLGSPAVARANGDWLKSFMAGAAERGYRVDFIVVHFYQDWTNPRSIAAMKSRLTDLWQAYHLPIWITEVGTLDIRTFGAKMKSTPTQAAAEKHMRKLLPMLDNLPFVERYAWFKDGCYDPADPAKSCNFSSLYDDKGRLRTMGEQYRAGG